MAFSSVCFCFPLLLCTFLCLFLFRKSAAAIYIYPHQHKELGFSLSLLYVRATLCVCVCSSERTNPWKWFLCCGEGNFFIRKVVPSSARILFHTHRKLYNCLRDWFTSHCSCTLHTRVEWFRPFFDFWKRALCCRWGTYFYDSIYIKSANLAARV